MVVKKLDINGFRNLNNFSASFHEGRNLIFGVNGSGKTSVIEAIFMLGFGKSFLPVARRETVNFKASGFFLNAEVINKSGENRLTACLDRSFSLQLNGERSPLAQICQYLYPLFFSHFSFSHYADYIPFFRRLVDRFIFGLDALYLRDVLRYNAVLKQKNFLLKNLGRSIDNSELGSWNTLMAEAGSKIVNKRMAFIERLNAASDAIFAADLRVHYQPALLHAGPATEAAFKEDLDAVSNSEVKARRCLLGPQRDRFGVSASNQSLTLYSSGEKKKFLLMVYVAFIEVFRRARNDSPVFLIDDFDAAMDESNLQYLLDHFPALQIIATSVARNHRFGHMLELRKEC